MAQSYDILIPEIGVVHGGFDWKPLSGLDGFSSELNRLAASEEAAWYSVIKSATDETLVAFAKKTSFKKAPLAGVSILTSVLHDDASFISLVRLEENRYWLVYCEDGTPYCKSINQSTDFIGEDRFDILNFLRQILASKNQSKIPIYTDCTEIFDEISLNLDIRKFSLEHISETLKKSKIKLKNLKFKKYSKLPVVKIAAGIFVFSIISAGLFYWQNSVSQDKEAVKRQQQQEVRKRKQELFQEVDSAINATPYAKTVFPLYMGIIGESPPIISGWYLNSITCEKNGCMLTYKAKSFATWKGYLEKKPEKWPLPIFGTDTSVVYQPLTVDLPESKPRTVQELPLRGDMVMDVGNLSQIVKEVGVSIRMEGEPIRVAGNGSGADGWVPLKFRFLVSGPGNLAGALVDRIPEVTGLGSLDFKIAENITFEMIGEVYANP